MGEGTSNKSIYALNLIGKEFETKKCGRCKVIEYKNATNVLVRFSTPDCIVKTSTQQLMSGSVSNPMIPSLYKIGYMGFGAYDSKNSPKAYELWGSVLERCYSVRILNKRPTYKDVTVCNEWHNFQNFAAWCETQEFFNAKDDKGDIYQLDKDILVKGNKVYSPETCCFVPRAFNGLFISSRGSRGNYPIGVSYDKSCSKFKAKMSYFGKLRHLGVFTTAEAAFNVYKETKESYIKEVANLWKDRVDEKVYRAILNYEVCIDD